MLKTHLHHSLRFLSRNKLGTIINISGIALALTCVMLILLYVTDEIAYDRQHSNTDRIYRVCRDYISKEGETYTSLASVSPPIGPLLTNDFGEIEQAARTMRMKRVFSIEENGERKKMTTENDVFFAEPALFRIFDIAVLAGAKAGDLSRPRTVMLSEKTALKYFNAVDVVGKNMIVGKSTPFEITGVYKDFPAQSHWHPDFLLSFSTLYDSMVYGEKNLATDWGTNIFYTYMLLEQGADPARIEAGFPNFLDKHFGSYVASRQKSPTDWVASKRNRLYLQKLSDIHLHSQLDNELEENGNAKNLLTIAIIGFLIIVVAGVNFANITTALASKRNKETGVRKISGAFRKQLVGQYLVECVLISLLALVLALILAWPGINWLNDLTLKQLEFSGLFNIRVFPGILVLVLLVGLLSGMYPAFVLSGIKPAAILKTSFTESGNKGSIRKSLVVVQFGISTALIILTIILVQQARFLNSKELGFDEENLVTLPYAGQLDNSYEAFYQKLLESPAIVNVTRSSLLPGNRLIGTQGEVSVVKENKMEKTGLDLRYITIDDQFFSTYRISIAGGRTVSKEQLTETPSEFILNEAAVNQLGWRDLAGVVDQDFHYGGLKGKVTGLVTDFHFESLHRQIIPMIFYRDPHEYAHITVRLEKNSASAGLEHLSVVWKEFLPTRPFDYEFLSDTLDNLYYAENQQVQLLLVLSMVSISIACLGLFALSSFSTAQRMKEVGIRKILGASTWSIAGLLLREVLILTGISIALAVPASWYLASKWLENFAYHIDISVVVYFMAGMTALSIALMTISIQIARVSATSPVSVLKYE